MGSSEGVSLWVKWVNQDDLPWMHRNNLFCYSFSSDMTPQILNVWILKIDISIWALKNLHIEKNWTRQAPGGNSGITWKILEGRAERSPSTWHTMDGLLFRCLSVRAGVNSRDNQIQAVILLIMNWRLREVKWWSDKQKVRHN